MDYTTFPPTPTGNTLSVKWFYNNAFGDNMDGSVDPFGNEVLRRKKADLMYLRSGDKKYVIGILSNKTQNVNTLQNCNSFIWPPESDENLSYGPLETHSQVKTKKEDLFFSDLHSSNNLQEKYIINYFDYPGVNITNTSTQLTSGNAIVVKHILPDDASKYLVPFNVRKKGFSFPQSNSPQIIQEFENSSITFELQSSDSTEIKEELVNISLYPNPSFGLLYCETYSNFLPIIEISNQNGKILQTHICKSKKETINLENLSNGIYNVKIFIEGDFYGIKQIVKI